ncbi:FecCD family ABC transporter permease [[Clostridium] colinum]|uniref:FecCD family ABC transporter permease n=1 Tax=[Clostridium] colinum TaxID=36835 RepID=UPI0020250FA4|nr:iron ABC transporter permease [[Clostridium] colinum]
MKNLNYIDYGYLKRKRKTTIITIFLILLIISLGLVILISGKEKYSILTVIKVLMGQQIDGANFAILIIRLPRMLSGFLVGMSLAIAGNTFQTILRNSLASPDVIGISTSSSSAAVFCILILNYSGVIVSVIATIFGVIVAILIYIISKGNIFSNNRLILIGIGVQTMLNALISYMLVSANEYDISEALRWLSGSLNGVQMKSILSLFIITIIFTSVILILENYLKIIELGEELSITLGVKTNLVRVVLIISAVFLIAFSTSITGPISFVAFLSGPIAKNLVGTGSKNIFISGLVGAILVLLSDLVGQFVFNTRYPVGVMTGIIGAPYLLILLIKLNKKGSV